MEVGTTGTVDNEGAMTISKVGTNTGITPPSDGGGFSNVDLPKSLKTGGATVVNFLEIQSGGTFTVPAGGSLVIDGQDEIGLKSFNGKALNDTGIFVHGGGTFTAEATSNVDVINMIGSSTGVKNSGTVDNAGDFDITTEGRGIEIEAGTVTNSGEMDIAKMEGLLFKSSSGGATVVNFLEIQSGGTFTVPAGGKLTIDGQATLSKAASFSNDIGMDVNEGGTFIAEDNSTVNVINMIGSSTGVINNGQITGSGDFHHYDRKYRVTGSVKYSRS